MRVLLLIFNLYKMVDLLFQLPEQRNSGIVVNQYKIILFTTLFRPDPTKKIVEAAGYSQFSIAEQTGV